MMGEAEILYEWTEYSRGQPYRQYRLLRYEDGLEVAVKDGDNWQIRHTEFENGHD